MSFKEIRNYIYWFIISLVLFFIMLNLNNIYYDLTTIIGIIIWTFFNITLISSYLSLILLIYKFAKSNDNLASKIVNYLSLFLSIIFSIMVLYDLNFKGGYGVGFILMIPYLIFASLIGGIVYYLTKNNPKKSKAKKK